MTARAMIASALVLAPFASGVAQQPDAPSLPEGAVGRNPHGADAGRTVAEDPNLDARIAGMPEGTKPVILTLEQAYTLALIRARSARVAPSADRTAILRPEVLAAEAARVGAGDFARFRAEFLKPGGGGFLDPATPYLEVLRLRFSVEMAGRDVRGHDAMLNLIRAQSRNGARSSISQLQLDRIDGEACVAREGLKEREREYRDALDDFRSELGLSPGSRVLPDRSAIDGFRRVFDDVEGWLRGLDSELAELGAILDRLPVPTDLVIGAISAREVALSHDSQLDALLTAATQRSPDDPSALATRRRVRQLVRAIQAYEHEKNELRLAIRNKKASLDELLRPIGPEDGGPTGSRMAATPQTRTGMAPIRTAEAKLVTTWVTIQTQRMALYPSLGTLPYEDWEGFLGSFATTSPPAKE